MVLALGLSFGTSAIAQVPGLSDAMATGNMAVIQAFIDSHPTERAAIAQELLARANAIKNSNKETAALLAAAAINTGALPDQPGDTGFTAALNIVMGSTYALALITPGTLVLSSGSSYAYTYASNPAITGSFN